MSVEIFLMILGAALVHATWNALVKSDGDRLGLIKMMFRTQFGLKCTSSHEGSKHSSICAGAKSTPTSAS